MILLKPQTYSLLTLALGPLRYEAPHEVGAEVAPVEPDEVVGLEHVGLLEHGHVHVRTLVIINILNTAVNNVTNWHRKLVSAFTALYNYFVVIDF